MILRQRDQGVTGFMSKIAAQNKQTNIPKIEATATHDFGKEWK